MNTTQPQITWQNLTDTQRAALRNIASLSSYTPNYRDEAAYTALYQRGLIDWMDDGYGRPCYFMTWRGALAIVSLRLDPVSIAELIAFVEDD